MGFALFLLVFPRLRCAGRPVTAGELESVWKAQRVVLWVGRVVLCPRLVAAPPSTPDVGSFRTVTSVEVVGPQNPHVASHLLPQNSPSGRTFLIIEKRHRLGENHSAL